MRMTALACLTLAAGAPALVAAQPAWPPPPPHQQVAIWPRAIPDARPVTGPEVSGTVVDAAGTPRLVGGAPWTYVDRVSQPTMTIYRPTGHNSGAAVVVFPGGGYNVLAIDLEGTEACDWLVSKGITCVLLKYRVPCATTSRYRDCKTALQDAQRTIALVRAQAESLQVDPHRIGVLGFSAGGHMVAAVSTHFARRLYPPQDAADSVSCRPDFAIALYPGHLVLHARRTVLNSDIRVTSRTPPTLLVQAADDPVDPIENARVYAAALRKAGVAVVLQEYPTGGHAFGLRRTNAAITAWPALVEPWLHELGLLSASRRR